MNGPIVDLSTSLCQTKGCGYRAIPEGLGPTHINSEIKIRAKNCSEPLHSVKETDIIKYEVTLHKK